MYQEQPRHGHYKTLKQIFLKGVKSSSDFHSVFETKNYVIITSTGRLNAMQLENRRSSHCLTLKDLRSQLGRGF